MSKQIPNTTIGRRPFRGINNAVTDPNFFKNYNQNNVSEFVKEKIAREKKEEKEKDNKRKITREKIIMFANMEYLNLNYYPYMFSEIDNLLRESKRLEMIPDNINNNAPNSKDSEFIKSFKKLQNMVQNHNYSNNTIKSYNVMNGSGRENRHTQKPEVKKDKKTVEKKGKK